MKSGTGARVGIRYEGTAAGFGEFRLRYEGTAAGFGEYGLRELRKAAMRGMTLVDPGNRAEIQAGLRRAQIQDLRAQILGPGPRPGGDAA